MQYYLAVDIGASSGRHVVGWSEAGKIHTQEVYRFENQPIEENGTMRWDLAALENHVIEGMKACKEAGFVPQTMGIDTWGVDYVLLDENGKRISDAVCYRDHRNVGMDGKVEEFISFEELYKKAGIQKLSFNTVYQLMAEKVNEPERLQKAARILMMPEYLNYCLTGVAANEYTNATSTSLLDARKCDWDMELIDLLGYPRRLFGKLNMPGTPLGQLLPKVREKVGFDCTVALPATHDTGSAYLAVPAKDENGVYLSSGTWSLLGMESMEPVLSDVARAANFTNEGGYQRRYRFLKNIMGLWMVQSIRRELGKKHSFPELAQMAKEEADFPSVVDVNDQRFMAPKSMLEELKSACAESGQPVPENVGQAMQCVYRSLAKCYTQAISEMAKITGKTFNAVYIVGGGSQDEYLNQFTADESALPVYAGPVEGTVIGNLLVQMLAAGEYESLQEARASVAQSFEVKTFAPNQFTN